MKLNKIASVLLGMAMFCATSTLAADEDMMKMKMEMTRKPNGCMGPTLCPTGVMLQAKDCPCDANWKFQIGLIYEQPRFSEMHPGNSYIPSNTYSTSDTWENINVEEIEATFTYDVGLLVSLGYFLDHDNWYAEVHFDWLNSTYSKTYNNANAVYTANENLNTVILTGVTGGVDTVNYSAITYKASFSFYTLDFMLSRGAWMSKCFSFEYGMGIEALWFDTSQTGNYTPNTDEVGTVTYEAKENNWGVGPRLCLNGQYHLVQELYLFFDNSIGVLYGEATENQYSRTATGGTVIDEIRQVKKKTYYSMQYFVPVRSIIGAKFGKYCLEDKHYIGLKVGYDVRAVLSATNPNKGFVANGLYVNFEWSF